MKAINAWAAVSGITVIEGNGGIVVSYGNAGEASTLLTADKDGRITAARIVVGYGHVNNTARLLLHEFGHALGLAHSNVIPSVMNPTPYINHLSADDIAGVRHLYSSGRPPRR